jgi:hypothetical protein
MKPEVRLLLRPQVVLYSFSARRLSSNESSFGEIAEEIVQ